MRIRNVAAALVVAGAAAMAAIAVSGVLSKEPVPPALAEASLWTPDPLAPPRLSKSISVRPTTILALSRFDAAPLIAFIATKETNYALHGRVLRSNAREWD